MAKQKPHLNLVFIGHVDHGKSTLVGRLMFDSGKISPQELEILRSIKLTTSGKMILDPLQESISLLETFDLEARHALTEQLISSEKYIVKSHQKIVKLCKKFRH